MQLIAILKDAALKIIDFFSLCICAIFNNSIRQYAKEYIDISSKY